jgi:ABC-type xylose transport system permease subunit
VKATGSELKNDSSKAQYLTAYAAGKEAVANTPRWYFSIVIILAIVLGKVVAAWLAFRYSLPESKAFWLSLAATLVFASMAGLLYGLAIRRRSRPEIS